MRNSTVTTPLLIFALLTSWGCAAARALSVPARSTPSTGWQTVAEGVVVGTTPDLSRWWEQLGDSTLIDLIDRTLRGSPDVRSAQARLRQARAERTVTKAGLLPSVSASALASDSKNRNSAFSSGFDASWEVDILGGTRKAIDGSTADLRATVEDLHGTEVSLAAEVARTYVELRAFQARLDIARRHEMSQAETLELTGFRAQAGLVSSVDVEQARANLEQTRAQIPTLASSVAQAIHRLSTLAGLGPSALRAQLNPVAPLPSVPSHVAVGIPTDTLRQRPDVRAAEQRILAETARLAQAGTKRHPRFTLSGSFGTEIVAGALTGGTSLATSAAASALQTIFDGGRIREQIAIQSAVPERAVAGYEATVLTALQEVEDALVSYEKSRLRLASLVTAEAAASNAALLARNQYAAGLADFQTVLDTERTVLLVQESIATTKGERVTALVLLYKALGGGWSAVPNEFSINGSTTS